MLIHCLDTNNEEEAKRIFMRLYDTPELMKEI